MTDLLGESKSGGQETTDPAVVVAPSSAGSPTDGLDALRTALVKAAETKPANTAVPLVSTAFALGWHMSELESKHPFGTDGLPGVSRLDENHRLSLSVNQVVAGVNTLKQPLADAGLDPIDLTGVKALIAEADVKPNPVISTHEALLIELFAADPRVGKAYGLGRALADSCQDADDLDGLKRELNPYRIANLLRWLDDLASAFPQHAGHSVGTSLERWQNALYPPAKASSSTTLNPLKLYRAWRQRQRLPTAIATDEDATKRAIEALHRQGELWRALLSGEKHGTDMLEIDNYLDAGKELAHRFSVNARRVVLLMPLLSIVTLGLVGTGVWLLAQGSNSQLVAGATSVIAALGLTWKGLGGALGQLAGKLKQPLWDAVLDDVIADAITLLPDNTAEAGGRRKVALALASEREAKRASE